MTNLSLEKQVYGTKPLLLIQMDKNHKQKIWTNPGNGWFIQLYILNYL